MKSSLLFCCIIALAFVCVIDAQSSRLENFDINVLLKNDRILNNYIKCLLDKGPCTNDGRDLKRELPEALKSNCARCSPAQKRSTRKLIDHLETKKPDLYRQVKERYDPSGEYTRAFKSLKI